MARRFATRSLLGAWFLLLPACATSGVGRQGGDDRSPRHVPPPAAIEHDLAAELDIVGGHDADAIAELEYAVLADEDPYLYLRLAQEEAKLGRSDDANDALTSALRIDPAYADAYVERGALASASHDPAAALAAWKDAERADRTDEEPYLLRYEILIQEGDSAAAEGELRALVAACPSSDEGHYRLGRALLARGVYGEALAEAERAHALAPERTDAALLVGQTDERLGRLDAAAAVYTTALRDPPDRALARAAVEVLVRLGRASDAQAIATRADDGSVDPIDRLAIGRLYLAAGRPDRAAALAEAILAIAPDAEASLLLGDALAAKGDARSALATWSAIPDGAPAATRAREEQASLLVASDRPAAAAAELAPFVTRAPGDPELLAAFVQAAIRAGLAPRALLAAKAAAAAHPTSEPFARLLAIAYEETGDLARAVDVAEKIVRMTARDASSEALAARLLSEEGSLVEAERLARAATAAEPGDGAIAGTLGRILLRAGRAQEAAIVLATATRLEPTAAELFATLGDARVASGDVTGARSAYQSALSLHAAGDLAHHVEDALRELAAAHAASRTH